MDYETYLAERVREVFSRIEDVEERLDSQPESFLGSGTGASETVRLEAFESGSAPKMREGFGLTRPDRLDLGTNLYDQRLGALAAGRRGLTKIRRAGDTRPSLTEEEVTGLEAIIILEGRPAILIRDGHFAPPPVEWAILEEYRQTIERILPSVGRVEVTGHPRLDWIGTGFLVAPTLS